MSYTQIDNILGQPIPYHVVKQLTTRSKKTLGKRDNQALIYTANKSGWVRVVSSVDISGSLADIPTQQGPSLAQQNVLFGGISAYDKGNTYKQYPYYSPNPEEARPNQFDSTYGFRPMPGITSAKIITQGKLGSILIAEIDFKVNTKKQLDLIDILYFKIGYSMLVEWGNTFFYKHKTEDPDNNMEVDEKLQKSEDYAIDPFTGNPSKETIRIRIAKAVRNTEGNYGGMLGVVTNYNFSMNAEGGYDCKIKIMSPGMLAESMRVNGIPSLPKVYEQAIQNLANTLTKINKKNAEIQRERERSAEGGSTQSSQYPPCVRTRIDNKVFKITILGNETYAEAFDETKGFKGYGFFSDNKYFKTENGVRQSGVYECVGTSITDYTTRDVIGEEIPSVKTFDELYSIAKNNSNPKQYQVVATVNPYQNNPSITDYFLLDTTREQASKYKNVYLLSKYKKKIYVTNKSVDGVTIQAPSEKTTIKLNLGFNTPNATNKNLFGITGTNANWEIILQGGERVVERFNNDYKFANLPNESYVNGLEVTDYSDGTGVFGTGLFSSDTTTYIISYADGSRKFKGKKNIVISYSNKFFTNEIPEDDTANNKYVSKVISGDIKSNNDEFNNRSKIVSAINSYFNNSTLDWTVQQLNAFNNETVIRANVTIRVEDLPAIVQYKETEIGKPKDEVKLLGQNVVLKVTITDLDLLQSIQTERDQADSLAELNATNQAPEQPLQYTTVDAVELAKSEQSMYTSQLEAMLRVVQITTISETINDIGVVEDVKSISWTSGKYENTLYNGLFIEGAMMSSEGSILKEVATMSGSLFSKGRIKEEERDRYINSDLEKLKRYKINLYYGFHRELMKTSDKITFDELDAPEYKVDFKKMLTSYVIPYYQSKTLIDGGDIHYPTYIPLGFFFMMLNHCSFLYDTTDVGVNIPMFYLDFNPGSNIMLSSDFMLTANPYKFVVPFTGDLNSYKKLFDKDLVKENKIGSGSDSSDIWKLDAVSSYIPEFKYIAKDPTVGTSAYRGKTMNVLVSIDYLLDIIKRHSQRDETNSVYFRPLIEELLSDLGKCLGSYNIFRLAYDDSANCFYVVDDQVIPGKSVYQNNNLKLYNELPLFGKESIARSLNITTENSSKLGSLSFISANQDVKNQSTLGIDGTSIGGLSLFAVDRYKRVTTGANSNAKTTGNNSASNIQQKAVAASRFNEAVNSFYYGGLRSENMVDQAVNYYIEAVARTRAKGDDPVIRATTLLPVSVNFSTDGISSMAIYQSFTINDELLPYSYKYGMSQTETKKMGFVITGLEHTIQNNAWTTDVRANMYYVKRLEDYKAAVGSLEKAPKWKDIPQALINEPNRAFIYSGVGATFTPSSVTAQMTSFGEVTKAVITNLEGGYYHPDMIKDGRVRDNRYGNSGETMFGLDRLKGGPSISSCEPCKRFWGKIDQANARSSWSWNYIPQDPLKSELLELAVQIMQPIFNRNLSAYVPQVEIQTLIKSDGRLYFNFVYATWNGEGWFQGFSKDITSAYNSGVRKADELAVIFIRRRLNNINTLSNGNSQNSLIAQGGEKIAKITGISV